MMKDVKSTNKILEEEAHEIWKMSALHLAKEIDEGVKSRISIEDANEPFDHEKFVTFLERYKSEFATGLESTVCAVNLLRSYLESTKNLNSESDRMVRVLEKDFNQTYNNLLGIMANVAVVEFSLRRGGYSKETPLYDKIKRSKDEVNISYS